MKIYVASSWRNEKQDDVVSILRDCGYLVYDFKHPEDGNNGFKWSAIDENWKNWTPEQFKSNLDHPVADSGFMLDYNALMLCDVCVLVMPCGRSAHLELGYAMGLGKFGFILLSDGEPELMYKMAQRICTCMGDLLYELAELERTIFKDQKEPLNDQEHRFK
jgi:hypothetical protein